MKVRLILLLVSFLFTSCATLFYKKEYGIKFSAKQPNSSIKIHDTVYPLPAEVKVKRSKNDLPIALVTDGIQKDFVLKASPARGFLLGNAAFVYLWPVSYGVDFTNQKRFYYGRHIQLDANDTLTVLNKGFYPRFAKNAKKYFSTPYQGRKGQWHFVVGGPVYSKFYVNNAFKSREYDIYGGGVKLGFDYHYRNHRFLSLRAGLIYPIDILNTENFNQPSSRSLELTDNFGYHRFTFGYGVNYSINRLHSSYLVRFGDANNEKDEFEVSRSYNNHSFGLSFNTYFRFHNNLHIGAVYRPGLMRISPESDFNYEYLIGIEFLIKAPFKL